MQTPPQGPGIDLRIRTLLAVTLGLLVGVASCGRSTSPPDPSTNKTNEQSTRDEPTSDNSTRSDLPGRPIPDGPGRIKEGIHLRPGVEFAQLTKEESRNYIEIGEDQRFAYVTGPAREKLRDKDRRDVLMGHKFLFLIGSKPMETSRGLKVQLRKFSLVDIVWGDFEVTWRFDRQALRQSEQRAKPPYRKKQALNFPGLRIPLAKFTTLGGYVTGSGTITHLGGGLDFEFKPGITAKFEGRIPFVTPGYDCEQPPDYEIKGGCAFGGCLVDEDFCVEKVRLETTLETGYQASFSVAASGRVQATYPPASADDDLYMFAEKKGPPLTFGPISVRPDLYLGGEAIARVTGELKKTSYQTGKHIEMKFGAEYTNDDGMNFFEDIQENPKEGDDKGLSFGGTKTEFLLRLKGELGLKWNLTPTVTATGRGLVFELEAMRTAGELRLDNIYTFSPVDDPDSPVDGACFRSRLFAGPYVEPVMEFEAGLDFSVIDETLEVSLLPGANIWWRPFILNPLNAHGGGDLCLEDKNSELDVPPAEEDTGSGSQGARPFKVEASWRAQTDVDIHVETPNGTRIDASNESGDGGKYIFDTCGDAVPCSGSHSTSSESVVFAPAESAPLGDYEVWVTNDDGKSAAKVQLRARKGSHTYDKENVRLGGSAGATSRRVTLTK